LDLIFVTGDIVWHGKEEEYDLASREFFDRLLVEIGRRRDRLFIVPGNHDVNWDTWTTWAGFRNQHPLDSKEEILSFFGNEATRDLPLWTMSSYRRFVATYASGRGQRSLDSLVLGYVKTFSVNSLSVAVIGLNSAWLSGSIKLPKRNQNDPDEADDKAKLVICPTNIPKHQRKKVESADLRIALMHHPTAWLTDPSQGPTDQFLRRNCHFVLRGHDHRPEVKHDWTTGEANFIIPGGAFIETDKLRCGYNVVHVDLDERKSTIKLRRYDPDYERWTKDVGATGDEHDGTIECPLTVPGLPEA
jgi:predicted phosphodiesterase